MIPDREGDDVALAVAGQSVWVAWSRAALGAETVFAARAGSASDAAMLAPAAGAQTRRSPGGGAAAGAAVDLAPALALEPLFGGGAHAFRPAVAPLGDAVVVAACVQGVAGPRPQAVIVRPHGGGERASAVSLPDDTPVRAVAVAAGDGGDGVWIVWEQGQKTGHRLRGGWIDAAGRFAEVAGLAVSGRSPALASAGPGDAGAYLAWVDDAAAPSPRVMVARVDRAGAARPVAVDDHPAEQNAPAVCAAPGGGAMVAWHTSAAGQRDVDVLRWIRVAAVSADGAVTMLPPPDEAPAAREEAGFDQGWEFPALAVAGDRALWVVGRSAHGFRAARRAPDGDWSALLSLSGGDWDWGGRGRRIAVRPLGAGVLIARREPDGITVTRVDAAGGAPAAAGAAARRRATWPAPARERARGGEAGILFGDLHQHTAHSDGCGTHEELWRLARDVRRLDFAAITDHDRFCRRAIGPMTWAYMRDLADRFHEPGRFVTFPAYEFTGPRYPGPGHKCVYFGDRAPERVPDKDVEAIFRAVRDYGGLAAPHHVGWTGADLEHHDPEVQPVWEIFSVHGCYERHAADTAFPPRADCVLPGQFVADALDAGLRFGFIASTDSHGLLWHHGITRKRDPFAAGLAGVLSAGRDRASILDALRARRAYATTGARIELVVELDGAPMGSELPAGTRGALSVSVTGTGPLLRVSVVRRGGETPLDGIDGARFRGSASVRVAPERAWDYFYVRVLQEDGEMAWSSPIWIG